VANSDEEEINEDDNPVERIYKFHPISPPDVWLVLGVEAVIGFEHLTKNRTSFSDQWNNRMRYLNARGYNNPINFPKDHKGHLVASQFNGPIDWYNLVPQSPLLNLGLWKENENTVKKWLLDYAGSCPFVIWRVAINYNIKQSNRPKGFKLVIEYISDDNYDNFEDYYSNEIDCQIIDQP
jgi:hypothetical protein